MKTLKKMFLICMCVMCMPVLAACGEDEELTDYQEDMNQFFENVASCNEGMNSIDASAEDAVEQLLSYLDQLQANVTWMASLDTPEEFSAVDSLADEADENMKQAVALYHNAYEAVPYDDVTAQTARQYYDRANLRIQYIIMILHGEIPEGEGITYIEEDGILGGGYLNQTQENETDEESVQDSGQELGQDGMQESESEDGQENGQENE